MNVTLDPEIAKFVEDQVKSGRFSSAEEVILAALQALRGQQDSSGVDLGNLRGEIRQGLDEAERGELEEWDINDIRAEGQRLLGAARKKAV
jgi:antitoxin ParD1/3/4